ncbi:MTRF1L release factor glutamine methyltransferase isoform X5 [Prionailurus bengalensis]|uniref:MTRF1L release factor glutamine methyltransferase isoform X5 n=1 Tax=Prionailurus bengalensis TaxID=37029 RepID=UPI001CA8DB14|nr:MTRF1L release factor glutamine methyltransferase isoform X5 [Prionailurus bengalensis]
MELGDRMLRALLSALGRKGGTRGWAFSSWQSYMPLAGLLSATEVVSHWTAVFEKRGIPEAQASSEYIVAHVLGAKTELVEWVLKEVTQSSCPMGAQGGPLILEVGCGSGAISLSLLSQLPQSRVIAVDKGEAAICLTQENAQRLRLLDRIQIVPLDVTLEGSWSHLLPWGPMDLVISNPPYIFHQDMEQLAPEIRSYEDPVALDGGEEGMDIITHILALAPWLLKDSGSIFLEVDPRHPELVGSWLQSRPDLSLDLVAVRKDFCGRPRFLHIRRSGPQCGCLMEA